MEVKLDASVYDTPMITVIEVMGRNAGWLTAASKLASYKGLGPDLIYLPVPLLIIHSAGTVFSVFAASSRGIAL